MWPKKTSSSLISCTDAKSIVGSFAKSDTQTSKLTHNFHSFCQQLHDLRADQTLAMLDFLVYPVGTQGTTRYGQLRFLFLSSFSNSLTSFPFDLLQTSFLQPLSSSFSCHRVIFQDNWSTIPCSSCITAWDDCWFPCSWIHANFGHSSDYFFHLSQLVF